ncbi:MAG TPA: hypothetical protein VOA87_04170 [Thermoanaerobaculia bacterium]|nr:hypothetical protein [Thermoanaerobaculia bacterium]
MLTRQERAAGKLAGAMARRREAAARRMAKLAVAAPPESHHGLVLQSARQDAWATAAALLDLSREALPGDPPRAEALARLAVLAAGEMDAAGEPALAAELQAEACCQVGEACRLGGDLARAEEELGRAEAHLRRAFDAIGRAQFCGSLGRLRRDQRRMDEALALFGRAAALFEEHGNLADAAGALAEKGEIELRSLEPVAALETFDLAASLVPEGPTTLALRAHRGLALACALDNRFAEAWQVLAAARRRFVPDPGSVEDFELLLAGGELAEGEGDYRSAEQKLISAFHGLLGLKEWHLAALAGLNLARILLAQGSTTRLRQVVDEMAPFFAASGLHGNLLDALGRLRAAVLENRARVPLASAVLDHLKIARDNPSLPFDSTACR